MHHALSLALRPVFRLALLVLAAACGLLPTGCISIRPEPGETIMAGEALTLPSRRCAEMFLVEAVINQRGPFLLVVDTGAAMTVLTPEAAGQLEDSVGSAWVPLVGATGRRKIANQRVRVESLRVGELELRNFDAVVVEMAGFADALGGRLDGILGYPAFADLLLTLDYPQGEVRVRRGRLSREDPKVVPLVSRRAPTVDLFVQGKRTQVIIDSGSGGDLQLRASDLDYRAEPRIVGAVLALGGADLRREGRISGEAILGEQVFVQPKVEPGRHIGLVGTQLLKVFSITFDQRSRLVRLESAVDGPVAFPSTYGIGIGGQPQDGTMRITHIFPGLPAERAGLRVDDRIEAIDGIPFLELVCLPRKVFSQERVAQIAIRRGDQRMVVPVEVVVLVP